MADFADLGKRTASAIVLCCLGLTAILLGGTAFVVFACAWSLAMVFELLALSSPGYPFLRRLALSAVEASVCAICIYWIADRAVEISFAAASTALCAMLISNGRIKFALFAVGVLLACSAFADLRDSSGAAAAIWFVLVVMASDTAGYFCGKIFRGPAIAPALSPGKRWTGAVGGLAAATAVGFGFSGGLGIWAAWASPLLAVAAQAGDMAESWLKRQVGVKDSSTAIPGHGGFFDRFDSFVGAGILLWIIGSLDLAPVDAH